MTYPAPFDQPFFLQLNLAVGGDWPGNPDRTTNFDNAKFEIDYVRVYQKSEYDTDVVKPSSIMGEPDETGNYVKNADFSVQEDLNDTEGWIALFLEGGAGEIHIENSEMVVTTTAAGNQEYSVQLV